jgi:hypothetical protein
MHTFPMPNSSIHFNAVKLQNLLRELNKDRVNFINKNININDIDADYILDCSGKPNNFDDYKKAKYIPVNTAVVKQCKWDYPKYYYTLCIAAKYGWVFGIPLQDRISFGYLYNRNINNKKEILDDLDEIINTYSLKSNKDFNYIEFNNYYRKKNYTKNIFYNGNKSFFLEPMEATSLATIDDINRDVFDLIYKNRTVKQVNDRYDNWFKEVQDVITLHYLAGSRFKNEFWSYAENLAKECINKKSKKYEDILNNYKNNNYQIHGNYGTWGVHSFRQNIIGLGLENKIEKLI